MASGVVLSFRPSTAAIRASAASGSEGHVRTHGGGGKWSAPIFGWPSDPHYIGGRSEKTEEEHHEVTRRPARQFSALTEEKARELRMRMMEMETFRDAMYHSAIASRLASDRPRRSGL